MKERDGKMNKKEFRKVTEMLEENYNKKLDIRIFELWYEEFKDLPIEKYEKIVVIAIKEKKFMPTLAEMIELKKELPSWWGAKIEIRRASPEGKKKIENLLKEFRDEE